jgi:uncharacterized membrane protein (DUF373 family)
LWVRVVRELNVVDEAREAFQQMIKMAVLFGGMAIFYVWIEAKLLRKWKNKRRGRK